MRGCGQVPSRSILDDAPNRSKTVAPSDLLAFLVGTSRIGNAYLVHPVPALRDFCSHLWLEPEPVFVKLNALDDLATKHLVAGFHVAEVEVRNGIRKQRQEPVADRMPEIEDPVAFAAGESRSVNDVGPTI